MSNTINSANGAGAQFASSVLPSPTPPVASSAPKVNIPSDAEVVSKLLNSTFADALQLFNEEVTCAKVEF